MLKSENIAKQIEAAEEEIRQLKSQQKQLQQKRNDERRKERTHRLIERGAIFESLIDDAKMLTNEQVKIFFEKTLKTESANEILNQLREQTNDKSNEEAQN